MKPTHAIFAAVLAAAPSALAQASFQIYAAIGDSLTAGYESGSLVETHQAQSYPLHLARQGGAISTFQQPLMGEPGIPVELALVSLSGPTIVPKASAPGTPKNLGLPRPYNNMAVPGATCVDAYQDKGSASVLAQLILRGLGTQVQQALAIRPTFVTVWVGNNDVLGAAVRGRAIEGVTLTPKNVFRQTYTALIDAVKASGTRAVVANLPDVTGIPFVTTIKPYVVDPISRQPVMINGQRVPLIGPSGPLAPNTYVTLAAAPLLATGVGVPTSVGGRGTPLPDEVLLDAGEVSMIQDYVVANNQAIREIAGAAGFPVFDANALLASFKEGRSIGGVRLTADFLTGGIFSYDGVHPTDLGYALLANGWIETINASGANLPLVNVGPYLGSPVASLSSVRAPGLPLFSQEAYEQLLETFPTVDR